MPPIDVPNNALGPFAAMWQQIGDALEGLAPTEANFLNPQHPVNQIWGIRYMPSESGLIAERLANGSWRLGDKVLVPDMTAPIISGISAPIIAETSVSISVGTDEGNGMMFLVLVNEDVQPTSEQIIDGQDSLGAGALRAPSRPVTGTGTISFHLTDLAQNTTYWAFAIHRDAAGNVSNTLRLEFTTRNDAAGAGANFPPPPVQYGYGKDVTGGRGYPVFIVTSGASGTGVGTLRWALAQADAAGGGYIIPVVNAYCDAGDEDDAAAGRILVDMPNIDFDFRFAPGTSFILTGGRIEPEGNNQRYRNVIHQGFVPGLADGRDASSSADNVRIGSFSSDPNGIHVTEGQYWEHCGFLGSQDEAFTAAPRAANITTGNKARKITLSRCIVHPTLSDGHEMGIYLSGGVEQFTMFQNFCTSYLRARWPFVRSQTKEIEVINNYCYDFWQRPVENLGNELHVIGNYYAAGPRTSVTGQMVYGYGGSVAYLEDNITERGPMSGGSGTISASKLFVGNEGDLPVIPASSVPSVVPRQAGPRMYGGATFDVFDKYVEEAEAGSLPVTRRYVDTADEIPLIGGVYPQHNGDYIPNAYKAMFPGDTDLAAIIADGSAWDGYMVAERVGFWLQWDGSYVEPALSGTFPFVFNQTDETIVVDIPAGDVAYFAISARAIDDPEISEARSSYNAANLYQYPQVDPATGSTTGVNFHLYAYTSDGNPATFTGNNEGGLRRALSGIAIQGRGAPPASYLGSTDGVDQNSAAISVPGGTVNVGDLVIAHVSSGADVNTALFQAAEAAGLSDVQVVHWGHSDAFSGLGHYWIIGTATATTVGPITATGATSDTWQGASLAIPA